jgi:hypothetical protein
MPAAGRARLVLRAVGFLRRAAAGAARRAGFPAGLAFDDLLVAMVVSR